MNKRWKLRLSAAAEQDYRAILRWTLETFGKSPATSYARTLSNALRELTLGPSISGSRARDEISPGIRTLHVARKGRKGRHFVIFRVDASEGRQAIDVLRLLHDSMDIQRHLSTASDDDAADDSQH